MASIFDLFKKIEKKSADGMGAPAYLVVGLGNPGKKYETTRHNAGFLAIDRLAAGCGTAITRARFQGLTGEGTLAGKRVLFLKPQTYMNLSGEAIREAAAFYRIPTERVIVLCDDTTLDVGRMRVRGNGSDGGHNGLKSIIHCLGTISFARVRIGVGKKPHPEYDLADWVLGSLSAEDLKRLEALQPHIEKGVSLLLADDLQGAMQACNGVTVC